MAALLSTLLETLWWSEGFKCDFQLCPNNAERCQILGQLYTSDRWCFCSLGVIYALKRRFDINRSAGFGIYVICFWYNISTGQVIRIWLSIYIWQPNINRSAGFHIYNFIFGVIYLQVIRIWLSDEASTHFRTFSVQKLIKKKTPTLRKK